MQPAKSLALTSKLYQRPLEKHNWSSIAQVTLTFSSSAITICGGPNICNVCASAKNLLNYSTQGVSTVETQALAISYQTSPFVSLKKNWASGRAMSRNLSHCFLYPGNGHILLSCSRSQGMSGTRVPSPQPCSVAGIQVRLQRYSLRQLCICLPYQGNRLGIGQDRSALFGARTRASVRAQLRPQRITHQITPYLGSPSLKFHLKSQLISSQSSI